MRHRARFWLYSFLAAVGLYLLLAAGATALVAVSARSARASLLEAKRAAVELDLGRARASVASAQGDLATATNGMWRALLAPARAVPWAGRSWRALDALTLAARDVAGGAASVMEAAGDLEDMRLAGGKLPPVPWGSLAAAAGRAGPRFERARARIATVPADGIPGVVSRARASALSEATEAAGLIGRLAHGARIADRLLGRDSTILIVLQNTAEERATGGYPDQFAVLQVAGGRIALTRTFSDDPLPPGTDRTRFRRLNFAPDFSVSAARIRSFVQDTWRVESDAIVAVDADGIASLLRATGPVSVGGIRVDASSYALFSAVEIYRRFPLSPDRQRFEEQLIDSLMDRLLSGGDVRALAAALGAAAVEKHVLIWARESDTLSRLQLLGVAGHIEVPEGHASFGIFGNSIDEAWSKLFPFTARTFRYRASWHDGRLTGTLDVIIENRAPPQLPPYVLGPKGDRTFRSEMVAVGVEPTGPRRVEIPDAARRTFRYRIDRRVSLDELILHFFKQPSPRADVLDVEIALPSGAVFRAVGDAQVRGSLLVFKGETSRDRVFGAARKGAG